jgi:hypothetical protein
VEAEMLDTEKTRRYLAALLENVPNYRFKLDDIPWRPLGGGLSGAEVGLAIVPCSTAPLVFKAGPAEDIEREVESRRRYAMRNPILAAKLQNLVDLRLDGASELIQDPTEGGSLRRVMADIYFGPSSFDELTLYRTFEDVFNDYCSGKLEFATERYIELWLRNLLNQIELQTPVSGTRDTHAVGDEFFRSLPAVPWSRGVNSVLSTAAAFLPEGEELRDLERWWHKRSQDWRITPWKRLSAIHGDLRFANVLLRIGRDEVHLVDFGSGTEGHVMRDLAKFECDLLFRILPPPTPELTTHALRTEAIQVATSGPFNPSLAGSNNRLVSALKLLRGAYDAKWEFSAHPERMQMYRWFQLGEILKRLLWFEEVFTNVEGRLLLLRSVITLRRTLDDVGCAESKPAEIPGLDGVYRLTTALGCTGAYIPDKKNYSSTNETRNHAKMAALTVAAKTHQTVRLMAETGYSYLTRGPLFSHIQQLINYSGRFEVLLVNPYFVEAHGISAAYLEPSSLGSLGLHPLFVKKHALIDEMLGKLPPERVEVRFSRYGLPATLLITDDVIFYEPYFRNDRRKRERVLFDTFELRLEGNTDARKIIEDDFEFRWNNADTHAELQKHRPLYKKYLGSLASLWRSSHVMPKRALKGHQ